MEAVDGVDGAKKIQAGGVSCVVCDVNMPNSNGIELVEDVKKDNKFSSLPIIMLTAHDTDSDTILGLEAGANVVTSLVPPDFGLHGVARSSLDIDNSKRSAASVMAVLRGCGLEKGSPAEYRLWVEGRQKAIDWKT